MSAGFSHCIEYDTADTGLTYGWSKEHPENEVFVGGTKENPMRLLFNIGIGNEGNDWHLDTMTAFRSDGTPMTFCLTDKIMLDLKLDEWAQEQISEWIEGKEEDAKYGE